MEFVGFGLAVVSIIVAVALWVASSRQKAAAAEAQQALQARFEAETARAEASASAAAEALTQINTLQTELDVAIANNDAKAITEALWNLELERSLRQWSDVIVPTETVVNAAGSTRGEQLTFALGHEVDRLREEVGVAIRFDGAFDADFSTDTALAALRITGELLSLTAKHCDEVVLSLDQVDPIDDATAQLVIALDCFSWDDEESPEAATADLASMAERVDGRLSWTTVSDEEMKAELRIVLPTVVDLTEVDVTADEAADDDVVVTAEDADGTVASA